MKVRDFQVTENNARLTTLLPALFVFRHMEVSASHVKGHEETIAIGLPSNQVGFSSSKETSSD